MERSGLEVCLPALLNKALSTGRRIIVRTPPEQLQELDTVLWTYRAESFLPHGCAPDPHAARQPIWLTAGTDNPNGANMLVLTHGVAPQELAGFEVCCNLFDGRDDTLRAQARTHWQQLKEQGYDLTYWQQSPTGGWQKRD
jgi:DNA polymerase-3 subunit chi